MSQEYNIMRENLLKLAEWWSKRRKRREIKGKLNKTHISYEPARFRFKVRSLRFSVLMFDTGTTNSGKPCVPRRKQEEGSCSLPAYAEVILGRVAEPKKFFLFFSFVSKKKKKPNKQQNRRRRQESLKCLHPPFVPF
jgi:hypothetical protein